MQRIAAFAIYRCDRPKCGKFAAAIAESFDGFGAYPQRYPWFAWAQKARLKGFIQKAGGCL
jgi:hypothetical protein